MWSIGVWRRLVARYLGVVEVVGSNPVTPTSLARHHNVVAGFLYFYLLKVSKLSQKHKSIKNISFSERSSSLDNIKSAKIGEIGEKKRVKDVYSIRMADIVLSVALVLAAVLMYVFLLSPKSTAAGETATAVVTVSGKEYGRYPLDKDQSVRIDTDGGYNLLEIKDGKAIMAEADCPDGYCVSHGGISRKGEVIVCLPHKLSVEIETGEKSDSSDDIDAVVR